MAPRKKVSVVPLFSKLEQEYVKSLLPKVLGESKGIVSISKDKIKGAANPKHPFFKEISTIWNKPGVARDYFNEVIYSPSLNQTGTRNELIESVSTADKVGKSKTLFDLAHLQQKQFRREGYSTEGDYKFIQNLDNEVNSYIKEGIGRNLMTQSSAPDNKIFLHPDFKTPDKLVSKMDFTTHGNKVKFLGEDTPFTTQSEGFITNQIRNRSYHKHYENRLARWLTEKKLIEKAFQDNKISKGRMLTDMEAANSHITNIERDMRKLGLTSAIWDDAKKTFKYYGKSYDKQVEGLLEDMQKTYMLRNPPDRLQEGFNNRLIEYFMKRIGHKEGGIVDYGEMKPVVPPLEPGERQHLQKGGKGKGKPTDIFSKLSQYQARAQLPEVIGHTTKILKQLEGPSSTKPSWKVGKETFDNLGDASKKAQSLSIKYPDQDQKLIMTRGADTADATWNNGQVQFINQYGSTNIEGKFIQSDFDRAVQDQKIMEETPAMVWKAPEAIKNALIEKGTGKQWFGILKKAGVSPKELDDTSLAPFLTIHEPNTKFTKEQLLTEFDDLAPKIEVLTTGKRDQGKYLTNILTKFNNVRDSISGFSGKDQSVLNNFAGILEKVQGANTDKKLNVLANQTNKIIKQAYGVDNALMSDQIPTIRQIPAPIRSIFGDMQELFKTRGAAHAFNKKPSHAGDQVLPGGVNYREYLFKYTPNQFRGDEPRYTPGHSFDFSDNLAQNTFVHARVSDRTDNFGG